MFLLGKIEGQIKRLLLIGLLWASPLMAQESDFVLGLRAGEIAAEDKTEFPAWLSGLLGGGLGGALVSKDTETDQILYLSIGVGSLGALLGYAVAGQNIEPPDELLHELNGDYREGFLRGYQERLGDKRRKDAIIGGILAGLAFGLVAYQVAG